ncbi:MAG: hypothetical protein AAGA97_01855 [Pseudomonadota bacterium]
MPEEFTDPPIDWENEAIWVQNTVHLLLLREDLESDAQSVLRQRGEKMTISRDTLENEYIPVDTITYKPRFKPIRAVCLERATLIGTGPSQMRVKPGDAILQQEDGSLTVLSRHDFNCDYRIVGTSLERPIMGPFQ